MSPLKTSSLEGPLRGSACRISINSEPKGWGELCPNLGSLQLGWDSHPLRLEGARPELV